MSQRPSETHGEDEDFLEIIRMTRDCPRSSGDRLKMTLRYRGLKVLQYMEVLNIEDTLRP